MKKYGINLAILLVSLVLTQTVFADVKIKIRQTMSGQTYENTTYIKGKRQRAEQNMSGIQTVNLTYCDLKQSVQLMPASQTYLIDKWQQAESVEPTQSVTKTQTPTTKGGVVTNIFTIKDTGERKQMFGYTARHLIITMETESSPDACTPMKSKMQTDGWYIDATFALDCETDRYSQYRPPTQKNGGCQDRYQTKQVGTGKRGYPLYEKMTMFDDGGKETYSFVNEVVELSNTTLDAALFEIPADYREVKNSSELYASMAGQMSKTSSSDASDNTNSSLSSNIQSMASQKTTTAGTELGAKKEGVVCIGLVGVRTVAAGEGINPEELAGAIQNTLTDSLNKPNLEVVRLEAKNATEVEAEAKSKECDYVIYANISHKKGGGGMFGKVMSGMGSAIPGVGYGDTAGAIARDVAVTALYTAASISAQVKSKDEISLEIKIQPTGSPAAIFTKQYKAKAKSDGEDIITPIVEQAAQAITETVAQK